MNSLLSLDQSVSLFLKNFIPHNIYFDNFFSFFSLKGSSILIWILVIVAVAILEERKYPGISKKDKKFLVLFSLSFLLTTLIVEYILKNIFERVRPIATQIYQCPTDYSFPSGHAATAFAAATILSFFDKKRRWFYYTIAVLISFSRIYLGCHYFLDVLIGVIIGYFLSKILLKLFIKL